MGWDGFIIGRRYFKSTFGANKQIGNDDHEDVHNNHSDNDDDQIDDYDDRRQPPFSDDDLTAGQNDEDSTGVSDDVGDDDADDVGDACNLIPGHPTLPVCLHLGLAGQRDLAFNQLRRHHYSDSNQDQGDVEYKDQGDGEYKVQEDSEYKN